MPSLKTLAAALCIASAPAALLAHEAPAPASQAAAPSLASAPAGAETYVITSTGGRHGEVKFWTDKDGVRWSRESLLLRGWTADLETAVRQAPDGSLASVTVRGKGFGGDASETFTASGGRYRFESRADRGKGQSKPGQTYLPIAGFVTAPRLLVEALAKAPNRTLDLLPSGRARLVTLTTAEVANAKGEKKTLTLVAVEGVNLGATAVWMDGDRYFAQVDYLYFTPEGWESAAPELGRLQDAALAKRAPELLARIAPRQTTPVAFTKVKLFDAEKLAFLNDQTVVAQGGRIVAVGPSASTNVPAGARVIEGRGKTLTPGLWDAHFHYASDDGGVLALAQGITSVRDPGNKVEASLARIARLQRGELLGPRVTPVMLIDGRGPYTAQMAVVATTEAEAVAAVRQAKAQGFKGVKLYGSLDKALVPAIAAEADRQGLWVQGHLPHGLRPLEAIRAGYDEITHLYFVAMQGLPDDVVEGSNTMKRFYGPLGGFADVDFASPQMAALLDEMAKRKTVVDPTLALVEGFAIDPGVLSPSYAPFAGTLPAALERSLKTDAGLAETPEVPRARMRASVARMVALVGELHRRGVPIVAGTDGYGIEMVRDVELYAEAGMTPAEALATATINPARAFGVDGEVGSIAVGKFSDLVLVDGDPSKHVGNVRHVEWVMQGDRLMKASDLREAAGLSGPPRR